MTDARKQRFVVADSSPLIGLAAAGAFDVLRGLYERVTITRLVKDEVTGHANRPGAPELEAAMRAGWVRVAPTPLDTWKYPHLDAGEASTLALAAEHDGALVLMDDVLGRAQAAEMSLAVAGTLHMLVEAKRAQLIARIRPLLDRLARRGFTWPRESLDDALASAGEQRG